MRPPHIQKLHAVLRASIARCEQHQSTAMAVLRADDELALASSQTPHPTPSVQPSLSSTEEAS
jgi:hypothetical protein